MYYYVAQPNVGSLNSSLNFKKIDSMPIETQYILRATKNLFYFFLIFLSNSCKNILTLK